MGEAKIKFQNLPLLYIGDLIREKGLFRFGLG